MLGSVQSMERRKDKEGRESGEKQRERVVARPEPPSREMFLCIEDGLQRQAYAPEDGDIAAHAAGKPRAVRERVGVDDANKTVRDDRQDDIAAVDPVELAM